jgi:hypothetical protein
MMGKAKNGGRKDFHSAKPRSEEYEEQIEDDLFIYLISFTVPQPCWLCRQKQKHITKLQITNQKQINRKQIPPPSAVGFTQSGDEAPLVRK